MERKRQIIHAYFSARDPTKPLYAPEINHILRLAGAIEGEFDCSETEARMKRTWAEREPVPAIIPFNPKDRK
jgi:hypothetical protein